jgi:hypothetical protein
VWFFVSGGRADGRADGRAGRRGRAGGRARLARAHACCCVDVLGGRLACVHVFVPMCLHRQQHAPAHVCMCERIADVSVVCLSCLMLCYSHVCVCACALHTPMMLRNFAETWAPTHGGTESGYRICFSPLIADTFSHGPSLKYRLKLGWSLWCSIDNAMRAVLKWSNCRFNSGPVRWPDLVRSHQASIASVLLSFFFSHCIQPMHRNIIHII